MEGADESFRYNPGENFEEDTNDPLVDISLTDSTELWLIQWPVKQLAASDFHEKQLKLDLHRDGKMGSLETSSGKSFDMVSYAAQTPNATVLLPTSSDSKVVGKISRRVCLCRYLDPDELEQSSFSNPNLCSQRGSCKNSSQRSTVLKGSRTSRDTFTFAHSMDGRNFETPEPSRKKKKRTEGSSHGSRPESHVTDPSL